MSIHSELESLIKRGQIIQAVKRYREVFGSSLKDSKAAIDMYRHHGHWPDDSPAQLQPSENQVSESLDTALLTQEVRALWSDGMKVNAIKRYREETGAGLKESKQMVEAICADIVIDGGIEPETYPAQTVRNTEGSLSGTSESQMPEPQLQSTSEIPVLQLIAKDHPIWEALKEAGLSSEEMMMVEAVCNLEDGVLIVGPHQIRFWVDRFHKWIERLDIERADVTKVELSNIGQKTRLVVRHKRGSARFQGIEAEIAKQFEQAMRPKLQKSTSLTPTELPIVQSLMSQDEKIGRVIDWIIDQPLPNGDKTLKKMQHRISRSRFRPAAEQLIDDVQSKGQGQIDLVEVLFLGTFLKLEWSLTLTAQDYKALLEAEWSPPPENMAPPKGRSIFGCLLLLAVSAIVAAAVFVLIFA
ncbi:MAG: hypothetical protein ACON4U_10590 [Myxococcota bacterium]